MSVPTIEEYLRSKGYAKPEHIAIGGTDVVKLLREFSGMHANQALQEAYKKARIVDDPNSYCGNTGSEYPPDQIVSKESILNAYPLENIK
jgi:hypothetical protein